VIRIEGILGRYFRQPIRSFYPGINPHTRKLIFNMKVFISWSGERSRKVAELLAEWTECVIQISQPWISSLDIDGGSLWFTKIYEQLANTRISIFCLTRENKAQPWILF